LPDFVGQPADFLRGVVVAPRGVDGDRGTGRFLPEQVGEKLVQGLVGQFGRRVPERHVQGADGHTPLAVAAGLLPRHHAVPGPKGVQGVARRPGEGVLRCGEQSRREALADEPALGEPADGRKAKAHDRHAGAADVRNDRDRAGVQVTRRNLGIGVT
jgi:hypothetical protein